MYLKSINISLRWRVLFWKEHIQFYRHILRSGVFHEWQIHCWYVYVKPCMQNAVMQPYSDISYSRRHKTVKQKVSYFVNLQYLKMGHSHPDFFLQMFNGWNMCHVTGKCVAAEWIDCGQLVLIQQTQGG